MLVVTLPPATRTRRLAKLKKPNVALIINNLLSPFIFSLNCWPKLIVLCVVNATVKSQDVFTALVRCVYKRIKKALLSHTMLFAPCAGCVGPTDRVTDVGLSKSEFRL